MTELALADDGYEPRERGLIFSAHSVRELLAGRKLRTRRLVTRTNSTADGYRWPEDAWAELDFDAHNPGSKSLDHCFVDAGGALSRPGNQYLHVPRPKWESRHRVRSVIETGDVIWVKEAWGLSRCASAADRDRWQHQGLVKFYRADGSRAFTGATAGGPDFMERGQWRTPLFMPRWVSRISMVVTEVRCERLDSISEEEAALEGAPMGRTIGGHAARTHREGFRILWDELHGEGAWELRPWVWVYCWEKVEVRSGA